MIMEEAVLGHVGEYLLRRASEADIEQVIQINEKTLPEHYSDYFYFEVLKDFPEGFIVAELYGRVVGYIMCRIEYGFSNVKRFGLARKGHIVSIAVMSEHRKKGIGTSLIKLVIEEMARKSCTETYLEVRVTNNDAISLYEKMNYRIVGRIEGYYRDGESAYIMARSI
jgi:ribosomal-protein-alanine N-acetyltransferase